MGGWVGPVLAGLSAVSGMFGTGKQKSTTTSSSTTTPNYEPQMRDFRDYLLRMYQDQLQNDYGFGDAYKTSGLLNIGRTADTAASSVADILSSRGLSRTTAGASALADTGYRAGRNISDFLTSVPLTLDARRQSLMGSAGGFLSSLPVGTISEGTSTTEGSMMPSSPLAGAFQGGASGLAAYLGKLQANQSFQKLLEFYSKQGVPK